jgi:hypothetical protein
MEETIMFQQISTALATSFPKIFGKSLPVDPTLAATELFLEWTKYDQARDKRLWDELSQEEQNILDAARATDPNDWTWLGEMAGSEMFWVQNDFQSPFGLVYWLRFGYNTEDNIPNAYIVFPAGSKQDPSDAIYFYQHYRRDGEDWAFDWKCAPLDKMLDEYHRIYHGPFYN